MKRFLLLIAVLILASSYAFACEQPQGGQGVNPEPTFVAIDDIVETYQYLADTAAGEADAEFRATHELGSNVFRACMANGKDALLEELRATGPNCEAADVLVDKAFNLLQAANIKIELAETDAEVLRAVANLVDVIPLFEKAIAATIKVQEELTAIKDKVNDDSEA
jgi:hypothetical protein